ncbi:pheromone A receptor-domain-containing protein [Coprinopsis sp. MPI-PUGE-AT-0042]|nr:pheromone A receptor-domain-containing protein [Coprinopsis sp. MPI-PUGE-AT-0042]
MSASNQAFSALSFITLLLVLLPLPWHLEAWNTGTILYIAWTSLSLLNYFINSIVWSDNVINWAPVWCDISSKLIIGASVGIPCAALCINRRLYHIGRMQVVTKSKADKVRGTVIDCGIGILIPVIIMALHYVVQGHRFDIFEEFGCFPYTYNVTLQYALIQAPTLLISLVSAVYAVLSIITFRKRQSDFREVLSASTNASVTVNRYLRLMGLAGVEVAVGLPLAITACVINATINPVQPWISWADTHFGFSRVDQIPASLWKSSTMATTLLETSRWFTVLCGLAFFCFFGLAEEARRNYKAWVEKACRLVGVEYSFDSNKTKLNSTSSSFGNSPFSKFKSFTSRSTGDLPIYVKREVINKRDSFESFSDTTIRSMEEKSKSVSPTPPYIQPPPVAASGDSLTPAIVAQRPRTNSNTLKIVIGPAMRESTGIFISDAPCLPPSPSPSFPSSVSASGSFLDLTTPGPESMMKSGPHHRV